jgi:hypothetical protein
MGAEEQLNHCNDKKVAEWDGRNQVPATYQTDSRVGLDRLQEGEGKLLPTFSLYYPTIEKCAVGDSSSLHSPFGRPLFCMLFRK